MNAFLHDLQPLLTVFIVLLVPVLIWAAKGWLRDAVSPLSAKMENLSGEVISNREAAQLRDAEHGRELGMLAEALRGLKEAFERQSSTHDSLQSQVNRAIYQQGKQEAKIAELDTRTARIEHQHDQEAVTGKRTTR